MVCHIIHVTFKSYMSKSSHHSVCRCPCATYICSHHDVADGLVHTLQWCHNGHDGISNHQPHDCLLNLLFRHRSKEHQSSVSLAFVRGIHQWPVNSPHKGPVTRNMFSLDDIIMIRSSPVWCSQSFLGFIVGADVLALNAPRPSTHSVDHSVRHDFAMFFGF